MRAPATGWPRLRGPVVLIALVALAALGAATGPALSGRSPAAAVPSPNGPPGYWMAASDGGLFAFGGVGFYGSMGGQRLNAPVVGMAPTNDGKGYWLVASDGGIFAFGDAGFHGSMGGQHLNAPIVGMATDPVTGGYWLVASDGGIFAFGAPYAGSMGGQPLNRPVVGMATTNDGNGYWLVASDGGIFAFGDAGFHGSTGSIVLNRPVVGMAGDPVTGGYWLVASDGGIFAFGAPYAGSMGGQPLNRPVVGMGATPDDGGYWLVASDGGIFAFGNAPFRGSTGYLRLNAPVVDLAQGPGLPGYFGPGRYASGSTGYDISWPQCGGSYPPTSAVAIVGVNDGLAGTHNPCLGSEAAWAGNQVNLYMNINWGGQSDTGSAYAFGYDAATSSITYAYSSLVYSPVWWLDVETCSGCWSGSSALNLATIQGAVAGLQAGGLQVGIYSTSFQWGVITGGAQLGLPQWVPGAGSLTDLGSSAPAWCGEVFRNGAPGDGTVSFDGGPVWMIQYGYFDMNPPPAWDPDYAC